MEKMQEQIPFSPPRIDQKTIDAVTEVLRSGWITTGPKTKLFEQKISDYCGVQRTLCLNSATAGLEIMLRWFGVGQGDEVILPAYTYSATANVVLHTGAKPVLVDVNEHDFNISIAAIRKAITPNTKVIMPVDIGGLPVDYGAILDLVNEETIKKQFVANHDNQEKLGRIFILADSAHSFGAKFKQANIGAQADAHVFSFHAVKNLTTAEGGAVTLNFKAPFNVNDIYSYLCIYTLHGQSKDALAKTQPGAWRYDILEPGYKCNMMDLQAAIGLVELERYAQTLEKRKWICDQYNTAFQLHKWAILPTFAQPGENEKQSSYHLYMLRINGATEQQRDAIIGEIAAALVSVNVHFIPLPLLTAYKNRGYQMQNYPITYTNYSHEISLPVYYDLTENQIKRVTKSVVDAVNNVLC